MDAIALLTNSQPTPALGDTGVGETQLTLDAAIGPEFASLLHSVTTTAPLTPFDAVSVPQTAEIATVIARSPIGDSLIGEAVVAEPTTAAPQIVADAAIDALLAETSAQATAPAEQETGGADSDQARPADADAARVEGATFDETETAPIAMELPLTRAATPAAAPVSTPLPLAVIPDASPSATAGPAVAAVIGDEDQSVTATARPATETRATTMSATEPARPQPQATQGAAVVDREATSPDDVARLLPTPLTKNSSTNSAEATDRTDLNTDLPDPLLTPRVVTPVKADRPRADAPLGSDRPRADTPLRVEHPAAAPGSRPAPVDDRRLPLIERPSSRTDRPISIQPAVPTVERSQATAVAPERAPATTVEPSIGTPALTAPPLSPLASISEPTVTRPAASPEATARTLEAVVATVRDLSTPERPSIEAVVRDAEMGTLTIRASVERGGVRAEVVVADLGHARAIAEAARERAVSDVAFAAITIDIRYGNGRAREEREEQATAGRGSLDLRPTTVSATRPVAVSDGRLDLYA